MKGRNPKESKGAIVLQTEALSGSSKNPTTDGTINCFYGKNRSPSNSTGSRVKMYIGVCKWCKEWGELVHTRNYWGDEISICTDCLKNPSGHKGRAI